jgi:hypothetical protein
MSSPAPDDLDKATSRFDAALARLELALASSVSKVADLARRTGFEDGRAQGLAQASAAGTGPGADTIDLTPILREELEVVRAREANLQEAVSAAKSALDEAMDDIRTALGPI